MSFGASAQEASRIAAQAAVDADVLFHQTGDPAMHLQMTLQPSGYWTTETLLNAQQRQESYSQGKNQMMGLLALGASVLGAGAICYFFFRR